MIILHCLLALTFIGYHYSFFSYSTYIFNYNKKPLLIGLLCGVINILFWVLYSSLLSIRYEPLALILYALLLYLEFSFLLRLKPLFSFFISITFCSNLFAKRFILLASMALYQDVPLLQALDSPFMNLLIMILTFGISISTINFARTRIPRVYLDTILADNKNIYFLTSLLATLYGFLILISLSITDSEKGSNLSVIYAIAGLFGIVFFSIFIAYSYNLADLRLSAKLYSKTVQYNEEQSMLIEKLHHESTRDDLTGLATRDTAASAIEAYKQSKDNFFIIFIDIDGLKFVNDNFGHTEGDFYIQATAQTISSHFSSFIVSRYGGDEIVVIGSYESKAEITARIVKCFTHISNLKNAYNKKYTTSISYGLVFASPQDTYTAAELLNLSDKRMYEFKKLHKKTRKTVAPL